MSRARPDWGAVADKYITGDDAVTHRFLADALGVHPATVHRQASIGEWSRRRQEYREQVARKSIADAAEKEARRRIAQRERNRKALVLAQSRLIEALQDAALRSSSVDTAARTLCEVIRTLELLAGEPDSRQETEHKGGIKQTFTLRVVEPEYDERTGDREDD